jgi:hypothetical protein
MNTQMRVKTSIFKGVSKFRNKWRARIGKNTIGIFAFESDAALAYNKFSARKNQLADKSFCVSCKMWKLLDEFYIDKRKVLKVSSFCKVCQGINTRISNKGKRLGIRDRRFLLSSVLIDKINNKKITLSKAKEIWNDKQAVLSTD